MSPSRALLLLLLTAAAAATGNTAKDGAAAAAAEQTGAVNPAGGADAATKPGDAPKQTDPTAVAPVAQPQVSGDADKKPVAPGDGSAGGGKPTNPAPADGKPATNGPEPPATTPEVKIEPKPATDAPPPTAPQPKVTPAPTIAEATDSSTRVTRSTPTPLSKEEQEEILIKCPLCWLTIREMDALITSMPKFDNDHFAKMIANRCKVFKTKALKMGLPASKADGKRPGGAVDHCAELSQASAKIYLAAIDTHMRLSAQHICVDLLPGWCPPRKIVWYQDV